MSAIDPEILAKAIAGAEDAVIHNATSSDSNCTSRIVSVLMLRALIKASKAHLSTLPRVKEVEVWHVESVLHGCTRVSVRSAQDLADNLAVLYREDGHSCVRVTGPHKHQVPS